MCRIGARLRSCRVRVVAATLVRALVADSGVGQPEPAVNATTAPSTPQRLLPWLAVLCGALTVLAGIGALPAGLAFVFKPLTTLLIIAFAWPRGSDAARQRRLIRTGLILSLAGDVFLLWPKEGFLPGLIVFLLAHLAYIAAFCVPLRFAARPLVFVGYAVLAAAILAWLWPGVPAALRVPVLAYVLFLATMAAQAASWWRRSRSLHAGDVKLALSAALGGALFMASDTLLAINMFGPPLPFAPLWILLTYWLAQWCIVHALRSR